jgi:hypothetical protein
MAILDGQNTFSTLATGDLPRTQADVACASTIDQGPKGLTFRSEGGAYVAPWLVSRVVVAATSGSSAAYIQLVLQDDVDDGTGGTPAGTWADIAAGAPMIVTALTVGVALAAFRIPSNARRHLRVVYRITVEAVTAGTFITFLTNDHDIIDESMRQVAAYVSQSGQNSMAVANGVLNS